MYIEFDKWILRCLTCTKRNKCGLRDALSNQRLQANCYLCEKLVEKIRVSKK